MNSIDFDFNKCNTCKFTEDERIVQKYREYVREIDDLFSEYREYKKIYSLEKEEDNEK